MIARNFPPGVDVSVELGRAPAEWPAEAALPDGLRVVGGTVRRQQGELAAMHVHGEVDGDPDALLEAFERGFAAAGWRRYEPPTHRMGRGGFVSAVAPPSMRLFCRTETDPFFVVTLRTHGGVRALISWESGRDHHPMRAMDHGPGGPLEQLMPDLQPPPGVLVQGGGGGGGDGDWHTLARAQTSLPPGELETHYRKQLTAAGWTFVSNGGDDVVAWSRWKMPKADWEAMLIIAAFGEDLRDLSLQMRSPAGATRAFRMSSGSSMRMLG